MYPAPVDSAPWHRLPQELADAIRPELPSAVAAVTAAVTAGARGVGGGKFERDAHTAVRVGLERFLDLVGTEEPALSTRVREVFLALGAAEAREDHGPDALLAALRTASRMMFRMATEAFARIRPVSPDALVDLSEAISAYVDELAAASTDGFARQLRSQASEGDRRRRQLAELLLRGGAPHSVVAGAGADVGWRPLDTVVPVLVPSEQARDIRFRYGADGVVADRGRDAVLLLRPGPRAMRTQLADAFRGCGAVVGPALGWAQVPEGVRLAELTAELVGDDCADVGGEVVFADDHLTTLALRGVPGALAVLSARRLAPFGHLRAAQRESLLATLHSWLRHWGSRGAVSAELYVHPQTVSYRLKRLRDLLGEDLDDPAARFELLLVLAAGLATRPSPLRGGCRGRRPHAS